VGPENELRSSISNNEKQELSGREELEEKAERTVHGWCLVGATFSKERSGKRRATGGPDFKVFTRIREGEGDL